MISINQGAGKTVSVLTPTYNRASQLKDLWQSLCLQTSPSFVWVIVDDGSMDNTVEVVQEFIAEGKVEIVFLQKSNGGKHTALNFGIQKIQTPLTFIVDSDDTLTPDAIETIEEKFLQYKNETDLCGFSFLRAKRDGGYLSGSGVPYDDLKESFCECRINRNIQGDMAEVWFTYCLKEYPFPEIENEKFIGEDLVWVQMSEKYKLRFYNKAIYISDYLDDGLTKNRRKHNIKSPNGCMMRAEAFLAAKVIFKIKIKSILQYIIYGKFANFSSLDLFKRSKNKLLYCLFYMPAMFLYKKWKKEFQNF